MELNVDMIDFSNIDNRIDHLDKERIAELIQEYYNGSNISELKKEYDIKVANSQLVKIFPKRRTEQDCRYCNVELIIDWQSRSAALSNESYCPNCNHTGIGSCYCKNCINMRNALIEQENELKKQRIAETYDLSSLKKVDEKNLTLEDKLYLSVLIRSCMDENLNYILPVKQASEKLTPTSEFTTELIKTLTGRDLIAPHPDSSLRAFPDDEDFPFGYYIYEVIYTLNIEPHDGSYFNMVQRLLYPSQEEFEEDKEFCFQMWKKIAVNESLEYLSYSMEKVGFNEKKGAKTIKVLERLLEYFSVAQIYSIIYKSIANSTKLYQEGKLYKNHASNTVITSCESFGERAIAEGWNLTKYRRDFNLPETVISKVLFTSILKIGSMSFEEKPTSEI
ncbi:hypothetical protein [Oceanobacillus sp. CAU 1775]